MSASDRPRWQRSAVSLCWVFAALYCWAFWRSLQPYWFHPAWTTDDALQQAFPFHRVLDPALFPPDLITNFIESYLPPLHRPITALATQLSGNVILAGHWVMLLQLTLALVFFVAAVWRLAGAGFAALALVWLLHTRHVIQRLTCGLPRGWAVPVLAAYLYFVTTRNHPAIVATIVIGLLLNPPAALVAAVAYGFWALWLLLGNSSRPEGLRALRWGLLAIPFMAGAVALASKRPPGVGPVVTLDQALGMPELLRPDGRFPFVPLIEPWQEITTYGFRAFNSIFFSNPWLPKTLTPWIVLGLVFTCVVLSVLRRRALLDARLVSFISAALVCFAASRFLAFTLFVPDRYLLIPLALGMIALLLAAAARLQRREGQLAALILALLVFNLSGDGLRGDANFNVPIAHRGEVWRWIRANTAPDVVVAGHPTHLDRLPLLAARRAFVTTETSHPLFPEYYQEMKRRHEIVFRAYFAPSLPELVRELEGQGIDLFVFRRRDFYPEILKEADYFPPTRELVKTLASRPFMQYAFRELPLRPEDPPAPWMPYKDAFSVVIDLRELARHLEASR